MGDSNLSFCLTSTFWLKSGYKVATYPVVFPWKFSKNRGWETARNIEFTFTRWYEHDAKSMLMFLDVFRICNRLRILFTTLFVFFIRLFCNYYITSAFSNCPPRLSGFYVKMTLFFAVL